MGELIGGLIQMNSHMKMTEGAMTLLAVGAILTAICLIVLLFDVVHGPTGWKFDGVMILLIVMGVAVIMISVKIPRDQIIHACADGQVSLEQVAGRYDILEIDGKELTLRVR